MNKLSATILTGLMLLGASLPGFSEHTKYDRDSRLDPNMINLKDDQKIEGTFQGFHQGQILMRTTGGQDIELPSMSLFFGTDPQIHQSELTIGQPLTVCLPQHSVMHVISTADGRTTLGSYDGVAKIPSSTVTAWESEAVWAADR